MLIAKLLTTMASLYYARYSPRQIADNVTFNHGKIRAEGAFVPILLTRNDPDIHCFSEAQTMIAELVSLFTDLTEQLPLVVDGIKKLVNFALIVSITGFCEIIIF